MNTEKDKLTIKIILERIVFFFPFQLLLVHFKKYFVIILMWAALFGFVTSYAGISFGIPYLFLYPEFLGKVDFTSHLILGFACGGFIMAFNIASYILHAYSFPFLATLSRPFFKFCVNNFIIPVLFLIIYIYSIIDFQSNVEFELPLTITSNVLGFLIGNILFILISLTYFFSTNRSVFELLKLTDKKNPEKKSQTLVRGFFYRFNNQTKTMYRATEFRVETYLSHPFKIALARESKHYDAHTLSMVFSQNHINASLFEVIVIITIIVLGIFRENEIFQIPAGASIMITFSMFIMIFSALYSWLKGWSTLILTVLIFFVAIWSNESLGTFNQAYGLDYSGTPVPYTSTNIYEFNNNESLIKGDIFLHLQVLENWKQKNQKIQGTDKPKLVFLNVSGGGLRAAMWTYWSLAHLDSLQENQFLDKVHLISGSSGGILGAAYYRELYYQKKQNKNLHLYSKKYVDNISKDLLNPIVFTIAVHDIYYRFEQYFTGSEKIKDRAFAFEQQFHKNTEYILDKKLRYYAQPEANSDVPLMILSPTVVNDARKLLISPLPISFLTNKIASGTIANSYSAENIEFTRFFGEKDPYNLDFSSALRMNATFPYILPNVSLPTKPRIEVMDAGIRDNFGTEITLQYINTFQDWISQNTSGVVIIQLRDLFKIDVMDNDIPSNFKMDNSPLTAIYGNVTNIHNYIQDNLLVQSSNCGDIPIDVVYLQLKNPNEDKISLSWHLTKKEKRNILDATNLEENQQAFEALGKLLNNQE